MQTKKLQNTEITATKDENVIFWQSTQRHHNAAKACAYRVFAVRARIGQLPVTSLPPPGLFATPGIKLFCSIFSIGFFLFVVCHFCLLYFLFGLKVDYISTWESASSLVHVVVAQILHIYKGCHSPAFRGIAYIFIFFQACPNPICLITWEPAWKSHTSNVYKFTNTEWQRSTMYTFSQYFL